MTIILLKEQITHQIRIAVKHEVNLIIKASTLRLKINDKCMTYTFMSLELYIHKRNIKIIIIDADFT